MTDYSSQIGHIRKAASLNEIQAIAHPYPAKANSEGGVLYSDNVDEVRSEAIAFNKEKNHGLI